MRGTSRGALTDDKTKSLCERGEEGIMFTKRAELMMGFTRFPLGGDILVFVGDMHVTGFFWILAC